MPLDAIYLSELRQELAEALVDRKIDRIHQPEKDTVLFTLRGKGPDVRLLCCFGSGSARICLTESRFENPAQPPMFCMLLRKYLLGAKITEVIQPEAERMLFLRAAAWDELGQPAERALAVELLGRNSNLILIGEDGRILDAGRRVDEEMSPVRQILPGLLYRMPPKPEPGKFSGLSPLIRREMEWRGLPPTPEGLVGLGKEPTMLVENGAPKDFTFLPILQYGPQVESVTYPGWSELLDVFYAEKDRVEHVRSRAKNLTKLVRNAIKRTEKKLELRRQELSDTEDLEEDKRKGDLITANIWRMEPGQSTVVLEDFYQPDSPQVTIALDSRKSPQQNAAQYYRQYRKKKTAQEHLTALIADNQIESEYLSSIAAELACAQNPSDLDVIRQELVQAGYLKESRGRTQRNRSAGPHLFVTSGGMEVLVGRNNLQNDDLTFRTARRTDLWLHVQKLHGSHVILRCEGAQPDEKSIYEAACLAAFYSEGNQAGHVPVDATWVRYVKKPKGAKPGMVIYSNQRTILAEPKQIS